ncbi:hypothetical protein BTVI_122964 [Pitangus sulphuratus]|nr:hypothetical protein BTVI_122964 [Pitangus sulphuratus]
MKLKLMERPYGRAITQSAARKDHDLVLAEVNGSFAVDFNKELQGLTLLKRRLSGYLIMVCKYPLRDKMSGAKDSLSEQAKPWDPAAARVGVSKDQTGNARRTFKRGPALSGSQFLNTDIPFEQPELEVHRLGRCERLVTDVIHTVGPIARGHLTDTHKENLASCYKSSLKLAKENNIRSIIFLDNILKIIMLSLYDMMPPEQGYPHPPILGVKKCFEYGRGTGTSPD